MLCDSYTHLTENDISILGILDYKKFNVKLINYFVALNKPDPRRNWQIRSRPIWHVLNISFWETALFTILPTLLTPRRLEAKKYSEPCDIRAKLLS